MGKLFIFLLFLVELTIALPTKQELKILQDLNCSPELLEKAVPNDIVLKKQCNITVDSAKDELEEKEKLCLVLHYQILEFCQNEGNVGNAKEVEEVKLF